MKVARTVLRALGGKVPDKPVTRPHLTLSFITWKLNYENFYHDGFGRTKRRKWTQ